MPLVLLLPRSSTRIVVLLLGLLENSIETSHRFRGHASADYRGSMDKVTLCWALDQVPIANRRDNSRELIAREV